MKKLLVIIGALSMGGAEHMVYELLKHIDRSRFQASILCYAGKLGTPIEEDIEKTIEVIYLDKGGTITLSTIRSVFSKINEINPDIIHAHLGGMVYAIPWTFLHSKKRLVVTAHTKPSQAFNRKIEGLLKWMLRHRGKTTKVVAVSEENHYALMEYLKVDANVCRYVNNGIDLERFFQKEHSHFTYINVARQDENKNQVSIVRAFSRLYKSNMDIRLILVGDGPCHQNLVEEAQRLGVSDVVLFPGMVSDVENYYAVSDVYIQSSFREAMPLSALEAMAAGLPLISTNVGGMKDITKENGILISAGDDGQLYHAMECILKAGLEEISFRSMVSRELVKNYSSKKMAEEYMNLYDEILEA